MRFNISPRRTVLMFLTLRFYLESDAEGDTTPEQPKKKLAGAVSIFGAGGGALLDAISKRRWVVKIRSSAVGSVLMTTPFWS